MAHLSDLITSIDYYLISICIAAFWVFGWKNYLVNILAVLWFAFIALCATHHLSIYIGQHYFSVEYAMTTVSTIAAIGTLAFTRASIRASHQLRLISYQAKAQELVLVSCLLIGRWEDGKLIVLSLNDAGTYFCQKFSSYRKQSYQGDNWYELFPDLKKGWSDIHRDASFQEGYTQKGENEYWKSKGIYLCWEIVNLDIKEHTLAISWRDCTAESRIIEAIESRINRSSR